MKDAIGQFKCETCKFFHSPKGEMGVCIANPPTAFIVGVTAASPLVDPTKPGAEMAHVVRGYFPMVGKLDGCGKHTPEFNKFN